jgi:hypothetical protein
MSNDEGNPRGKTNPLQGWEARPWKYGLETYTRADGATITPSLTAGGKVKWEARHPKRGLAATERGYPTKFGTLNVARKWVEQNDG